MMNLTKPRILAFAGSLREHSYNRRVVMTAMKGAIAAGADVDLVDLKDYPMPIYNGDDQEANGFPKEAIAFQELLSNYDGLLISSPEYNGSLPAALKNSLDWASRQSEKYSRGEVFKGKVAAIMTASPGAFGGIRCLNHLRSVLSILLVNVLPSEIAVANVNRLFEGNGTEMTDARMRGILIELGESLTTVVRQTTGGICVPVENETSA